MGPGHSYHDHRARYANAIHTAESHLEHLVASDPESWTPVTVNNTGTPPVAVAVAVAVARRRSPVGDVFRATVHLDLADENAALDLLDAFHAALTTAELRPSWDKLVEQASTLELVDPRTRVVKTDYRLGWPASPRDTVTISRTTSASTDRATYLIDCATSLPRFADEPSFLRPSPPYVRSHVTLYAWVLEIVPATKDEPDDPRRRLQINLYWSWSLHHRGPTPVFSSSAPTSFAPSSSTTTTTTSTSLTTAAGGLVHHQHPYQSHLAHLVASLVSYVQSTLPPMSSASSCHVVGSSSAPKALAGSGTRSTVPATANSPLTSAVRRAGGGGGGGAIPTLLTWSQNRGVEMIRSVWDESGFKWSCEWDVVYCRRLHRRRRLSSSAPRSITGNEKVDDSELDDDTGGGGSARPFVDIRVPAPASASVTVGGGGGGGGGGRDGWDIRINRNSSPRPLPSSDSVTTTTTMTTATTVPSAAASPTDEPHFRVELVETVSQGQATTTTTTTTAATATTRTSPSRYTLRIVHRPIRDEDGLERYKVSITRLVGGKGIRINGQLVAPVVFATDNSTTARRDGHRDGDDKDDNGQEAERDGSGTETTADELEKWDRAFESASNAVLRSSRSDSPLLLNSTLGTTVSSSSSAAAAAAAAGPAAQQLSTSPAGSSSSTRSFLNSSSISLRSNHSATTAVSKLAMPPQQQQNQQQVSTLLRRSYIYFLSLLQEPPAKWKPITDSASGVTVSQLLSPDPTLTIYRAEAVFVGVTVWDVFASVVGGGKASWDKGLEDSKLVRQDESSTRNFGTRGEGGGGGGGGGELSEVWWEKRKGNWPVAPRDSVTLRTSYKSPTSIHIFSFSTDDKSLFPHLPPVEPPTIRTQTDLSGWAIEALSPTTTSITLLDQSDPKGWSNKSWTPNHLVQQVASVRDFTLRHGAPPVVTRLAGGARKRQVGYDHDKGMFRVEYEYEPENLAPLDTATGAAKSETSSLLTPETGSTTSTLKGLDTRRSSLTTTTTTMSGAGGGGGGVDDTGGGNHRHPIELELRCDVSVWSPQGLDLMIDPPPSSVSCLSRHRLSSGGGLWLTIEHPPLVVESEGGKVVVTVRKASKANGSGGGGGPGDNKGGVTINGARVKVDVEVLEEDKVRELEARKRRKFSPVPLDQYETLGARVWNHQPGNSVESKKAATSSTGTDAGPYDSEALASAVEPLSSTATDTPVSGTPLNPKSTTPTDSVTSTPTPAGTTDANATPAMLAGRPPVEPPAAALEALAYLQSFHAEQGPDLTDPAPGWSIVSERGGTVVRKKIIPRISEVIPVYRGDKIVQGLTADEIASVVTSCGCRKLWDERVDRAVPLASYGNGISTVAISTKPAFPFKGRIFHVASVVASVKVPSASSTSSTSTVLFVASASYTPPPPPPPSSADAAFDPAKVNPNSLLTGQVLLEGWILETLDPYTSSVLAIPSTRCTYLASIDQKGSVPLALNQVLNANLAKSIGNVESFGKTRGPIPRIWSPSHGVQIEGPLSEDGEGDCLWKLGRGGPGTAREGEVRVVTANYGDDENTFRALFKVGAGKYSSTSKEEDGSSERPAIDKKRGGSSSSTPTTKSLAAVGSTLLKSELPRSASLNFGTAAPPILHKSSVTSELSHKRSRGSLRSKSPVAPPVATGGAPLTTVQTQSSSTLPSSSLTTVNHPNAHDLVVAELIVDLKQYPHGYSVLANSCLLGVPPSSSEFSPTPWTCVGPLSLDPLPPQSLAPSPSQVVLPLRLTAHDAPLPSILTASLDAWKRANHLVRILVPTSSITHPVQDPLREPAATRVEKPEWYRSLVDGGGALVEVKIVPLPAPSVPGTLNSVSSATERPRVAPTAVTATGPASEPVGLNKVTGQANRTVVFNGEKVTVTSQKESRVVLARFEDEDAPLQGAKLSRVPRRKRKTTPSSASTATAVDHLESSRPSSLPLELQSPLAISTSLLAPPQPSTPVLEDDLDFPDPKSPGMTTPAHEGGRSRSPAMSKSGSVQAASNRRSTTSSESTPLSGPLSALLGSYPLARLGSSLVNATTTSSHSHHDSTTLGDETPGATRVVDAKRNYSFGFVVAVALIAFLLGSFLRSLLSPADYIIYHAVSTTSARSVEPGLLSSSSSSDSVEKALLTALDPHRRWREAKRLVELRTGGGPLGSWFGWDLIVAAVKRD